MLRRWLRKWLFAEEIVKLQVLDDHVSKNLQLWEKCIEDSEKSCQTSKECIDLAKEIIEHNHKLIKDNERILNELISKSNKE